MKSLFLIFLLITIPLGYSFQSSTEDNIDKAYQNAKKGIYWALANIPERKEHLSNELIADDILYADVKLSKEIDGVKIESEGFYNSNSVSIKIYKSNSSLIKEGYLRPEKKKEN